MKREGKNSGLCLADNPAMKLCLILRPSLLLLWDAGVIFLVELNPSLVMRI